MSELPKKLFVAILGLFSAIYIFNPGAGFVELIPDNLPIVGNFDEAAATTLLIACLAYFGLDVSKIFGKDQAKPPEKPVAGDVVEEK